MDTSKHTLNTLFEQLGLPADNASVEQFIADHAPLQADIQLGSAPFWSEAQARFLKQGIEDDADWAEVIDELDALLRH